MNISTSILICILLCSLYGFIISGNFMKSMFFSAIYGGIGLSAVYAAGLYTAPIIAITPISVATSILFGLPGVIGMLMLKLMNIL